MIIVYEKEEKHLVEVFFINILCMKIDFKTSYYEEMQIPREEM